VGEDELRHFFHRFCGGDVRRDAGLRRGRPAHCAQARLARPGRRLARHRNCRRRHFGLFGLVIAFTFSGAASRLDARRNLIVEEVNTIGTAYLRLDIVPVEAQPGLRDGFRRYLDARIQVYRKFPDATAVAAELEIVKRIESEIWTQALAAERDTAPAAKLLLPALNQMFDISTKRTMTMSMHPPNAIYAMLFGLGMISSMIAGYGMAKADSRAWFHVIGFAAVIAIVSYVILDIEHPRQGFIRIDALDRALVDLRASMK
jgi:hypothetical protein